MELWTQLGRVIPPHDFPAAIIAAHCGRIDEARARSQSAVAQAEAEGIGIADSGHSWVLGFVELSTRRRRRGAPVPETRVRASQRIHARAGPAPGAGRSARSADRGRRARRSRRGSRHVGRPRRPRSTGPGRSRSSRAFAGSCSPRAAISRAPSRASSERSSSMPGVPIRSTTPGRCSRSGERNGARRSAAPHARRSRTHSDVSSGSAHRSGPSRRAPSWRASAGERLRKAS